MGYMKLCGHFQITPESGQGIRPIVPHCSGPSPCIYLGPGSAQCEYTIMPISSRFLAFTGRSKLTLLLKSTTKHKVQENVHCLFFVDPRFASHVTDMLFLQYIYGFTLDTCSM